MSVFEISVFEISVFEISVFEISVFEISKATVYTSNGFSVLQSQAKIAKW